MWTEIYDPEHEYSPHTWCFLPGRSYEALATFEEIFDEYPDWGWCDDCRDEHSFSGVWVTEHDKTLPEVFRSLCEVTRKTVYSRNYEYMDGQWWVTPHSYTKIKRQTVSEWIEEHRGEYWVA